MSDNVISIVNGEETELDLAALAGVEMDGIEEVRFELCPPGKFHWKIENAELTKVEDVPMKDEPDRKVDKPVVQFNLEAVNCLA